MDDLYALGHAWGLNPAALIMLTDAERAAALDAKAKVFWQIVTAHLTQFRKFRQLATAKLEHEFSKEMEQKSLSAVLDLLLFNENTEMAPCLEHAHDWWIPHDHEGKVVRTCFPGDELHFERISGVKDRMAGEDTELSRREGAVQTTGEFHGEFCWLGLIVREMHDKAELKDRGSLAQLLAKMGTKLTPEPKNVAQKFNEWSDTMQTITDAYILSAAMKFFGMDSVTATPGKFDVKKKYSWQELRAIAKTFFKTYASPDQDVPLDGHVQPADGKSGFFCPLCDRTGETKFATAKTLREHSRACAKHLCDATGVFAERSARTAAQAYLLTRDGKYYYGANMVELGLIWRAKNYARSLGYGNARRH